MIIRKHCDPSSSEFCGRCGLIRAAFLATFGGLLLAAPGCAQRVPPPPPPGYTAPAAPAPGGPPPPPLQASTTAGSTISGTVRSFNYGPGGLDGLILDRGVVVHFPPEYANQVSAIAPVGTSITATGWSHAGPAGDTLFDAATITNRRTKTAITVTPAGPPPPVPGPAGVAPPPPPGAGASAPPPPPPDDGVAPPPPPRGPRARRGPGGPVPPPPPPNAAATPVPPPNAPGPAQGDIAGPPPPPPAPAGTGVAAGWQRASATVRSAIERFNFGPNGETNGVLLKNGTLALMPPDVASQVRSLARTGATISVSGIPRQGIDGRTIIDVQTITVGGRVIGSGPVR